MVLVVTQDLAKVQLWVRFPLPAPFLQDQFNGKTVDFQSSVIGSIPIFCSRFYAGVSLVVKPRVVIPISRVQFSYACPVYALLTQRQSVSLTRRRSAVRSCHKVPYYAQVTKLANVSLSKREFCGFESHLGYHIHIETHSSLVVRNTGLIILTYTTKQLNRHDEKTSDVESVFQYELLCSHSIMALHILGKDENQVQFLVGAPISLLS